MRLRRVKNAKEILSECPFVIDNAKEYKGKYQSLFANNNPIHIEIGMGKGKFLLNMALENPDINFIGLEKYDSILVRAIEKIQEYNLSNIRIICIDALELIEVFEDEIDTIYLNFSDPWPKARHAKRRLSSSIFLDLYKKILINDKTIIQKTDNIILYESSLESYVDNNWEIIEKNMDLANSNIKTVTTEYEDKFRSLGQPIYYVKVKKK